jgi:type II secretory pathway component GspD/PulD (secretin)
MEDIGERVLDAILPSDSSPRTFSGQSSAVYYSPKEQLMVSGFLTFLEESGTAQILSSPSLIMRRGHSGSILSGEDIPITESNVGSGGTSYSVTYKSVGVKLRVTPQSIFEDRVVLEVSPEVSNIIRYEESGAGRNPVVAIRNASTMLEINDGYMVSIGGLIREEEIETVKRVPLLGNIPLVGWLFRSTSSGKIRSQLVIFLSVKVVDPATLSLDTVSGDIPQELREQANRSKELFPPKKSTLWTGIKNLFR